MRDFSAFVDPNATLDLWHLPSFLVASNKHLVVRVVNIDLTLGVHLDVVGSLMSKLLERDHELGTSHLPTKTKFQLIKEESRDT